MFYAEGELSRRIFIKGEAGSGKTVLSLKLVESWSQWKQKTPHECEKMSQLLKETIALEDGIRLVSIYRDMNEDGVPCATCEMEQCLSIFDVVYYVPLRDATEGMTSVVNLVCDAVDNDIPESVERTKRLLGSQKVRCLILLDGLDEWPGQDDVARFPNTRGLSGKCVLLSTLRPWKMVQLQQLLKPKHDDRIVTISGLSSHAMAKLIGTVYNKFYGINKPDLYSVFKEIVDKAHDPIINGVMRMPMMLIAACHMWYEEGICDTLTNSILAQPLYDEDIPLSPRTRLYLTLLNTMIKTAANKGNEQGCPPNRLGNFLREKERNPSSHPDVPKILKDFFHLFHFLDILLPFCSFAFQDLVDRKKLVFKKGCLERQIGERGVLLAQQIGLITSNQQNVRGKCTQENVTLSFYHKSFQELFAAMHLVCGSATDMASFKDQCSTVDRIMEYDNIIMFVIGLDPSVGCMLSKHVTDTVKNDTDVIDYRRTLSDTHAAKIDQLYFTQCNWYLEFREYYTENGDDSSSYSLEQNVSVSDIYLNNESEKNYIVLAENLMDDALESIVSVCLWQEMGMPIKNIVSNLPCCHHLSSLRIGQFFFKYDAEILIDALPELTHLENVRYECAGQPHDNVIVRTLLELPMLKRIEVSGGFFEDDTMKITHNMTKLETLILVNAGWTECAWNQFIESLGNLQHSVRITIACDLPVPDSRFSMIQSSPHCNVDEHSECTLSFTTN